MPGTYGRTENDHYDPSPATRQNVVQTDRRIQAMNKAVEPKKPGLLEMAVGTALAMGSHHFVAKARQSESLLKSMFYGLIAGVFAYFSMKLLVPVVKEGLGMGPSGSSRPMLPQSLYPSHQPSRSYPTGFGPSQINVEYNFPRSYTQKNKIRVQPTIVHEKKANFIIMGDVPRQTRTSTEEIKPERVVDMKYNPRDRAYHIKTSYQQPGKEESIKLEERIICMTQDEWTNDHNEKGMIMASPNEIYEALKLAAENPQFSEGLKIKLISSILSSGRLEYGKEDLEAKLTDHHGSQVVEPTTRDLIVPVYSKVSKAGSLPYDIEEVVDEKEGLIFVQKLLGIEDSAETITRVLTNLSSDGKAAIYTPPKKYRQSDAVVSFNLKTIKVKESSYECLEIQASTLTSIGTSFGLPNKKDLS